MRYNPIIIAILPACQLFVKKAKENASPETYNHLSFFTESNRDRMAAVNKKTKSESASPVLAQWLIMN